VVGSPNVHIGTRTSRPGEKPCAAAVSSPAPSRLSPSPLARADARQTIRFTPEADLAVLDPIWTTASQTTQQAFLVYDTLFGQDASYRPPAANAGGLVVENEGTT
jgi:peptide/nickel transport system substrate-binding protein